jgi:hypothetical protein
MNRPISDPENGLLRRKKPHLMLNEDGQFCVEKTALLRGFTSDKLHRNNIIAAQ